MSGRMNGKQYIPQVATVNLRIKVLPEQVLRAIAYMQVGSTDFVDALQLDFSLGFGLFLRQP